MWENESYFLFEFGRSCASFVCTPTPSSRRRTRPAPPPTRPPPARGPPPPPPSRPPTCTTSSLPPWSTRSTSGRRSGTDSTLSTACSTTSSCPRETSRRCGSSPSRKRYGFGKPSSLKNIILEILRSLLGRGLVQPFQADSGGDAGGARLGQEVLAAALQRRCRKLTKGLRGGFFSGGRLSAKLIKNLFLKRCHERTQKVSIFIASGIQDQ